MVVFKGGKPTLRSGTGKGSSLQLLNRAWIVNSLSSCVKNLSWVWFRVCLSDWLFASMYLCSFSLCDRQKLSYMYYYVCIEFMCLAALFCYFMRLKLPIYVLLCCISAKQGPCLRVEILWITFNGKLSNFDVSKINYPKSLSSTCMNKAEEFNKHTE